MLFRSRRWLWIIAALLSVNVVLVALLLKHGNGHGEPATVQAEPERQPAPMEALPAQPARPASETAPVEVPAPKRTVLPANEPILPDGGLVVLPERANAQNSAASLPPANEAENRMGATTTGQDTSQLQSWYELPQAIRDSLDLPRLDLHVWSEEPQNRFIMVNLKKYREGEKLNSGLVLEEILPDGMVMSYQGERFLVEK